VKILFFKSNVVWRVSTVKVLWWLVSFGLTYLTYSSQ